MMHDTADTAAVAGRASYRERGLEKLQPSSGWSNVRIWRKLPLRELDGLFMEAGGGWCSTVIMVPSMNKDAMERGPKKFFAFAQDDRRFFTCMLM